MQVLWNYDYERIILWLYSLEEQAFRVDSIKENRLKNAFIAGT